MCCELTGLPTLLRPVAGRAGYRSRQGNEIFLVSIVAHQAFYEIITTGCFNGDKVTGVYMWPHTYIQYHTKHCGTNSYNFPYVFMRYRLNKHSDNFIFALTQCGSSDGCCGPPCMSEEEKHEFTLMWNRFLSPQEYVGNIYFGMWPEMGPIKNAYLHMNVWRTNRDLV
jgi:hypothetical protein